MHLARASLAFDLHSPVHVVRPIPDVHTHCEKDVETFCTDLLEKKDGKLRRRLTEEESVLMSTTRTYSLTIAVNFGDKDQEESVQQAKDSARFLNYGPEADECLWGAFDDQKLSDKCASALAYVNDSTDHTNIQDGQITTYSTTTISIPGASIFFLISCYVLKAFIQDVDEDEDADDESINKSNQIAFIAVPLTVV